MINLYFDKEGQPITLESWVKLAQDLSYKRIAHDELPNGKTVSTVWLGINHSFRDTGLAIFETMIFPECEYCKRYATLEEAKAGHLKALEVAKS